MPEPSRQGDDGATGAGGALQSLTPSKGNQRVAFAPADMSSYPWEQPAEFMHAAARSPLPSCGYRTATIVVESALQSTLSLCTRLQLPQEQMVMGSVRRFPYKVSRTCMNTHACCHLLLRVPPSFILLRLRPPCPLQGMSPLHLIQQRIGVASRDSSCTEPVSPTTSGSRAAAVFRFAAEKHKEGQGLWHLLSQPSRRLVKECEGRHRSVLTLRRRGMLRALPHHPLPCSCVITMH
jgi:hypothetical protein